jgi:hypothetical protein
VDTVVILVAFVSDATTGRTEDAMDDVSAVYPRRTTSSSMKADVIWTSRAMNSSTVIIDRVW